MEWDDDILEEDNVFISQRDGESTDDTGENIQKFGGSVKLMGFVYQGEEALVDGLPDHLSPGHELSVKLVENVLEVVSLDGLFRIEEL